MQARRRAAAGLALLVLAATLATDAVADGPLVHPRSPALLAGAAAIGSALLVLVPRVRSAVMTAGAGIAAGGALATCVAGLAWGGGVPDPIVRGGLAFNVADLAIAAGDALLLAGALAQAWTQRARLHQPV